MPNPTAPKDMVILLECPQYKLPLGHKAKPYHCRTKREFNYYLQDFQAALLKDTFVLTFEDQSTVEVFKLLGTHIRRKSFSNSLRYYIILEVEY